MISAINKATGEQIELETNTFEQVVEAWRVASEYEKAAKSLKDKLKALVPEYVGERGVSEEHDGYMFRQSYVQKMNYDKAVMREVFDEDTIDLFLEPKKSAVDSYIKDHLTEMGVDAKRLRATMKEAGNGYTVIKLERLPKL